MDIDLDAKLYQALTDKSEREVSSICQNLPGNEGPMHVVTIHDDSVLHVALYSMQVKLVDKLLDMSKDRDLLASQNTVGNTILHEAATHDEFISVAKKLLKLQPQLLGVTNNDLETPLFSAARYGQMKMFKFLDDELYSQYKNFGSEFAETFHTKDDDSTVLQAAIVAEHFELAYWIATKHEYLCDKKNNEGLTALQLLACNPLAFQFRGKGWLKTFIHSRIKNNNEDEDSSHLHEGKVTSGYGVPWWEEMLRERRRYNVVVKLTTLLIKNDTSWKDTEYVGTEDEENDQDEELMNIMAQLKKTDQDLKKIVAQLKKTDQAQLKKTDQDELKKREAELKKKEAELKKTHQYELMKDIVAQLKKTDQDELKKIEAKKKKDERDQIPLLLATQTGCFEIVDEILKQHPQAVEHIDKKGRSILHIAIKYRQMLIFDRVLNTMEVHMRRLIRKCDKKGNSILHMVGKKMRNADVKQTHQKRSPFFQLQDDLLLFERIKKVTQPHFYNHTNNAGQTAEELLALNKVELRDKSQEWLKRTSENGSIIAVLIATVAFAAAYTVPGGSKPDGSPVLLNQTFFVIFTIGDVLSLTFCLTAAVIFLSILTSSYQLQEFKLSLPQKLMLGITCLLLSVTMMMLAFSATIILMIRNNEQWTKIALYTVALLPVTVLATVYMSLYWSLMKTFQYTFEKIGSFFPRSNSKNIDQSLGEKSNIGADVPIVYTTTAENSHSHV